MHAQKAICWLLLSLAFFPYSGMGQQTEGFPKLFPSRLTAYDLAEGLPVSCNWDGMMDKEGRLWVNPCFLQEDHRTINFYQFDGRSSEIINWTTLPEGANGPAALACQNEEGLLFGFFRDTDHFFSFDPDSRETNFFQLGRKDAAIIFMDYDPTFGLILLAATPDQQFVYRQQNGRLQPLLDYRSDFFLEEGVRPWSFLPGYQLLVGEHLWFLDVPEYYGKGIEHVQDAPFNLLQFNLRSRVLNRFSFEDLFADDPPPPGVPGLKLSLASDTKGQVLLGMKSHIYQINPHSGKATLRNVFLHKKYEDYRLEGYRIEKDAVGNLLFIFPDAENRYLAILLDTDGQYYDYSAVIQEIDRYSRIQLGFLGNLLSSDFKRKLLAFAEGGLIAVELKFTTSISSKLLGIPTRAMVAWDSGRYLVRTEGLYRYDSLYLIKPFSSAPKSFFPIPTPREGRLQIDPLSNIIPREDKYWYSSMKDLICLDKNRDFISYPVGLPFQKFTFLNNHMVAIAALKGGLFYYDLDSRALHPFLENGTSLEVKGETNQLLLTKDSTLWVASLQELLQIDLKSGEIRHLGKAEGFQDERMMCLHEDEKGRLWVGTYGSGIHIYDPVSGNIQVINSKKGLSNNTVIGILEDEEGIFWASTYDGINLISPEGEIVAQLSQEDGLSTNEFNRLSYLKGADGKLLFGSINGVNVLDPETIKKNLRSTKDLRIYLKSITRYDTRQAADSTQYFGFNEMGTLSLPAGHRYVVLDFALSTFIQPELQSFAYKVEQVGQDNSPDWIYLGNQHQLYLPILPPGRHNILIRGSDYRGNWTPDPIIIPIHVNRFFYQQAWFYFLLFLVLAGAVLAWMLRQRALRKKLETELAGRTQEIMETRDQLIIQEKLASLGQMVAGIAHEIKNPLNFVHNFSEGSLEVLEELMADLQKHPNGVNTNNNPTLLANLELLKQNLEFINQNGNRMNEIVSSMMQHARRSSGEQVMVDINRLIDSNITLAYHGFRATHPGFQANIIKDLAKPSPAIMAFPNELGRCLINLFDNACSAVLQKSLSGLNGYEPSIRVSTTAHTGRVEIRISDNGSGIPPHILDKIFTPFFTTKPTRKGNIGLGLSICHDIIVQQHKGQLYVESEEGEFAEFVILLPDVTAS